MSAQSDIPQAKRPKKGCNMKVASSLKYNLRQANILDDDIGNIDEKLTHRLSANVISYLQLCVLKVSHTTLVGQCHFLSATLCFKSVTQCVCPSTKSIRHASEEKRICGSCQ